MITLEEAIEGLNNAAKFCKSNTDIGCDCQYCGLSNFCNRLDNPTEHKDLFPANWYTEDCMEYEESEEEDCEDEEYEPDWDETPEYDNWLDRCMA